MKTIVRLPKCGVKPLVIAIALALPGSAAMAESMDNVVKTKWDQNIDQQYGRDSVYAFSPDAKPLKPEQTGSHDTNIFGTMKSYAADAWHKTEGFASGLWDKTTGLFKGHEGEGSSVAQMEPQPYGRAGGFVGADRIAVLESAAPYQVNSTPTDYSLVATPSEVKTGASAVAAGPSPSGTHSTNTSQSDSSQSQATQNGSNVVGAQPAPSTGDQSAAPNTSDASAPVSGESQVPRKADRFDNNDSAHGQTETGTQSR
jgi:hypothetical protein